MPERIPLHARLGARLVITPAPTRTDPIGRPLIGPCLIWQGSCDSDGYGLIKVYYGPGDRKQRKVHRIMYEEWVGPIVIGTIDHLCRVHACASPAHLEDVTPAENHRRGERANRPDCANGHTLSGDNLKIGTDGSRICQTCRRAHGRKHDALRRHRNSLPAISANAALHHG